MASARPTNVRQDAIVCGHKVHYYTYPESVAAWLGEGDGQILGTLLLEGGGYTVGHHINAEPRPLLDCLETLVMQSGVTRV